MSLGRQLETNPSNVSLPLLTDECDQVLQDRPQRRIAISNLQKTCKSCVCSALVLHYQAEPLLLLHSARSCGRIGKHGSDLGVSGSCRFCSCAHAATKSHRQFAVCQATSILSRCFAAYIVRFRRCKQQPQAAFLHLKRSPSVAAFRQSDSECSSWLVDQFSSWVPTRGLAK